MSEKNDLLQDEKMENATVSFDVKMLVENTQQVLNWLSRFVSKSATLPALSMVKLTAKNKMVTFESTDLESVARLQVGAVVNVEGETCVPYRIFHDVVKSMSKEASLRLIEKGFKLAISSSEMDRETTCYTLPADEYPLLPKKPDGEGVARFVMAREMVLAVASRVAFASDGADVRPILTGVNWVSDGSSFCFAATDGFRLARLIVDQQVEHEFDVIVPARFWRNVLPVLKAVDAETIEFWVSVNDRRTLLFMDVPDGGLFATQLISGQYPDYSPIIPKSQPIEATVSLDYLLPHMKTAQVIAEQNGNQASRFMLDEDEGRGVCKFLAAADVGDTDGGFTAIYRGKPYEVILNVHYFTDAVRACDLGTKDESGRIVFGGSDVHGPVTIKPVDELDLLHVIMPMHFGR